MQVQTFRNRLQSDLSFAVSYILANNPERVEENLRGLGYSVSNTDDIWRELNEMLADGRIGEFKAVLNVPMVTDGVDAAQTGVVLQVGQGMAQVASPNGSLPRTKSNTGPMTQEEAQAAGWNPTTGWGNNSSNEDSESNWSVNFSNVFGALINGFTTIMGTNGRTEVQPTDTEADARMAAQQEAERKAKRTRNILIGVGVGVAILIGILIWKPWKK